MTVQDWFEKRKEAQIQRRALEARVEIEANPDLWTKCVHCDSQLLKKDIEDNQMVCPVCDYHFRVNARTRINQLFDEGSFEGLGDVNHKITHFLKFAYYIQIIYTGLIVRLILLDVFYLRFS